jgi:hypothetical protein
MIISPFAPLSLFISFSYVCPFTWEFGTSEKDSLSRYDNNTLLRDGIVPLSNSSPLPSNIPFGSLLAYSYVFLFYYYSVIASPLLAFLDFGSTYYFFVFMFSGCRMPQHNSVVTFHLLDIAMRCYRNWVLAPRVIGLFDFESV